MSKSKALVTKIIEKMEGLNKKRRIFLISLFGTLLSFRGRHNFLNLSRYGDYTEKTYRLHYQKRFNFLSFNKELVLQSKIQSRIVAFDPSFIPKSGKHTPNLDRFWSGSHNQALKGLEIGGLALLDQSNNTAHHLDTVFTPSKKMLDELDWTRIDYYAFWLIQHKEYFSQHVDYLCVDGFFAKEKFISKITESTNLQIISKLRKDANLRYLYTGPKRKGPGRTKQFAKKINLKKIDKRRLKKNFEDTDVILYEGIVNSKTLKRNIKICYIAIKEEGILNDKYVILFSTDLELGALSILQYYKLRYQIEFLFRDAKQHTGLTHCQARSKEKMNFHVNAALTAVNIAKASYHLPIEKEQRGAFSMANIKTEQYNLFLLDLIYSKLDIRPNLHKLNEVRAFVKDIGKIAA